MKSRPQSCPDKLPRFGKWLGCLDKNMVALFVLGISLLLEARQLWVISGLLHFDHASRRKLVFKSGYGFTKKMILPADVQDDIITTRFDPIDLFGSDEGRALPSADAETSARVGDRLFLRRKTAQQRKLLSNARQHAAYS